MEILVLPSNESIKSFSSTCGPLFKHLHEDVLETRAWMYVTPPLPETGPETSIVEDKVSLSSGDLASTAPKLQPKSYVLMRR